MQQTPGQKQPAADMIDAVLKVQDRIHTSLTNAVGHPGDKLSFEELQSAINLLGERRLTFPKGILSQDVFLRANETPFVSLEQGSLKSFLGHHGTLLRIRDLTVTVIKSAGGCFVLFDPYSQN